LLLACALMSCDQRPKTQLDAARDTLTELKKIVAALNSASDQASAQAAARQIDSSADKLEQIARQIRQLPSPTPEETDRLKAELNPELDQLKSQSRDAMERLKDHREITRILDGPMTRVSMATMGIGFAVAAGPQPPVHRPDASGQSPRPPQSKAGARQEVERRR
jgi:DNA mismatch repair ATPase MutS